ncbi:MAG: tetratricopeptide repeat protein [Phycisphaerae bacterium]|nr:tetratricopeptide repeat protein [Phycisphaerae bacterium]
MFQIGRAAPLTVSAALMICAFSGCNSMDKKDATAPQEPPVMGKSPHETALAKAQVPLGSRGEVELVEDAQRMKDEYRQALETLLAYYRRYGYYEKGNWAEREIDELRSVTRYPYLGDHTAASAKYEPKETLAEADNLFAEARKLHEEATGLGGLLGGGKEKLKKALDTYRRIIERYPTSDKIDEAAFYAGEIYASDPYKEYTLAINFYQRCLNWNPSTELPAKFRMAVVYDYHLRDREKALALYKEVIDSSGNRSNVRFAQERVRQITDRASHEAPDAEPGVR